MGLRREIQGRTITIDDVTIIRKLILNNPKWHRTRISKELCRLWNWTNEAGLLKDIAARSLLRKLDSLNLITLPAPVQSANNNYRYRASKEKPEYSTITEKLSTIQPITIVQVEKPQETKLFRALLSHYHYLGYSGPVGENIGYLSYDAQGRLLGCSLFGAAAWKVACRDSFIGWDEKTRKQHLSRIANNTRFLILPGVRVPHLASHLLSKISRRVSTDWQRKYGHPILLLETFVEKDRFKGTCYKAANWIHVGETIGRTRNHRNGDPKVPIKSVWLYPLEVTYRKQLSGGAYR